MLAGVASIACLCAWTCATGDGLVGHSTCRFTACLPCLQVVDRTETEVTCVATSSATLDGLLNVMVCYTEVSELGRGSLQGCLFVVCHRGEQANLWEAVAWMDEHGASTCAVRLACVHRPSKVNVFSPGRGLSCRLWPADADGARRGLHPQPGVSKFLLV